MLRRRGLVALETGNDGSLQAYWRPRLQLELPASGAVPDGDGEDATTRSSGEPDGET